MKYNAELVRATAIIIRRLREANKLSQEALASEANLSRGMIDKIERRERLPSLDVLMKMAPGLETKASDMVRLIEQELLESSNRQASS